MTPGVAVTRFSPPVVFTLTGFASQYTLKSASAFFLSSSLKRHVRSSVASQISAGDTKQNI